MALAIVGCSANPLGGREECWPVSESRAAGLWRGILNIDEVQGAWLATPEDEVIPLVAVGDLVFRIYSAELVRGEQVVAKDGDDVTLFGGAGADGALKVCDVEEVHSSR